MVILAVELLREAENLIAKNVHPITITDGYRMASEYNALDPLFTHVGPFPYTIGPVIM